MGVETLLLGALALGGQAYQASQQKKAEGKANKAIEAQAAQQQALLTQEQQRSQNQSQQMADTTLAARARQRALASSTTGQQQSILTSPLGLSIPATTTKNNLGS